MAINTTVLPETWNMTLYENDTWPALSFTLVDNDGNPVTPQAVVMRVKIKGESEVIKSVQFTQVQNTITFHDVVNIPAGDYQHDIQATLSDGSIYTPYAGKLKVKQDIS